LIVRRIEQVNDLAMRIGLDVGDSKVYRDLGHRLGRSVEQRPALKIFDGRSISIFFKRHQSSPVLKWNQLFNDSPKENPNSNTAPESAMIRVLLLTGPVRVQPLF
jgi:hypothetical protein